MTPQEAAAKCRELQEYANRQANETPIPPEFNRGFYLGAAQGYGASAAIIDQIPTPKPWPPPEGVREVLAYSTGHGKWIYVSGDTLSRATAYTHWLPMPPAPEVQG